MAKMRPGPGFVIVEKARTKTDQHTDRPAQSTTGPAGCSRGCSVRRVGRAAEMVRSFLVLLPGVCLVHFYLLG